MSNDFAQRLSALNERFVSYAREQIQETVSLTQSLFNCRNFSDLARAHTQYVQNSFDRTVREANLITQDAALLARDVGGPMRDHMEKWTNMAQGFKG